VALELIHTSASSGLHAGTSGFCTVAMTTGLPASLEERLVALGGFRPAPGDDDPPPSFSHLRMDIGGRTWSVLTAVRIAPPDHSGRANKLAHHLALQQDDLVDAGPAWLLRQPGVVVERFEGPPRWIPEPRAMPRTGPVAPRRCDAWANATADAGWAGSLANSFLLDPSRVSCIVHGRDCDPLELIDEAISLLPPEQRWRVTFATHFQHAVAGAPCAWRFCLRGTAAAQEASRSATALYLDVDEAKRTGERPGQGKYTELARSGHAEWWIRPAGRGQSAERGGAVHSSAGAHAAADSGDMPEPWGGGGWDAASGATARISASAAPPTHIAAHAPHAPRDAAKARSSAAAVPGRERPGSGRVVMLAGAALLLVAVGAAVAVGIDRLMPGRGRGDLASMHELDRTRLEAEREELRRLLREQEEVAARTRADLVHAEQERDELRSRIDSLTAQVRSMESMLSPSPSPSPDAGGSREPARDSARDRGASRAGAAPGATQGAGAAAPERTPSSGRTPVDRRGAFEAADPLTLDADGTASFPPSRWTREVSHLGVVSTERQRLGSLPRSAKSLAFQVPASLRDIFTRGRADGQGVILATAPRDQPRADLAVVEVEGRDLFIRWIPSRPIAQLQRHLEALDAALPLATMVVELDDGSTLRIRAEATERTIELPRNATATVDLGIRAPALTLDPRPAAEWSVAAGAAPTLVRIDHRTCALRIELDAVGGTLKVRLLSPLLDELDGLETELRSLEADRPNVPPAEREFHEANERGVRDRIAALKARIAKEPVPVPAALPSVDIRDSEADRVVMRLRLVSAASGGSP